MTPREIIARALAEVQGLDPDGFDVLLICDTDNNPLPVWQAFEEDADAVLAALGKAGARVMMSGGDLTASAREKE